MNNRRFSKNFTLLVLGQVSSLLGNYTLKFALSMYVLEQTGSAAVFATLLAVSMVPMILLSPFGGMLADRMNRRNLMVMLDVISGCSVLALFFMSRENTGILLIAVLLMFLSVLGAFESPTVQACVPQMQTGDNILKGNAVVNQISAVTGLVTPFAGSFFYTAFGLRAVLAVTSLCFFVTALLECFIRLEYQKPVEKQSVIKIVKSDFSDSIRFLGKEQPNVLKLLFLAALASFFAIGLMAVGFPFLVRNVLGLSAQYYGAAESAVGAAAVVGGLSVSLLAGKLKVEKLNRMIILLGVGLFPAGIAFLLPVSTFVKYLVLVLSFCVGQIACNIFSIFALSVIQERTPQQLTGKVMSYVFTVSMCAQPLGQLVYGFLFDASAKNPAVVLLLTGAAIGAIGWLSGGFFKRFGEEGKQEEEKRKRKD